MALSESQFFVTSWAHGPAQVSEQETRPGWPHPFTLKKISPLKREQDKPMEGFRQ